MYQKHNNWDEDKWDIHSDKSSSGYAGNSSGSSGTGYAGHGSKDSEQDYHKNETYNANKPDEDKVKDSYNSNKKEDDKK